MITLYGVSGSPYVRKVQIVLAEKHLAYEMETVIPMVQPGGAVPRSGRAEARRATRRSIR